MDFTDNTTPNRKQTDYKPVTARKKYTKVSPGFLRLAVMVSIPQFASILGCTDFIQMQKYRI